MLCSQFLGDKYLGKQGPFKAKLLLSGQTWNNLVDVLWKFHEKISKLPFHQTIDLKIISISIGILYA